MTSRWQAVATVFAGFAVIGGFGLIAGDAGAAVKSPAKTFGEPRADEALVYFVREGRFVGSARTMFLYADQQFLGTLDNDTYTFAYVPPGKHLFWLNWARISTEVELEAGKEYYFSVWDRFNELDPVSGKAFIQSAKAYAKPEPKEEKTAAEHIRERYGKAQQFAAAKPAGTPGPAGSQKRREEHVAEWPKVDLGRYTVLFLEDFVMADPKAEDRKKEHLVETAPRRLPDLVAKNLGDGVFQEVRRGPAEAVPEAVVLRAKLTQYKPGSETARFLIAGAGSAQLEMEAELLDAQTGERVTRLAADRTWAWGGVLGASRGIEEMEANLAYELALYLKRSKGADTPAQP